MEVSQGAGGGADRAPPPSAAPLLGLVAEEVRTFQVSLRLSEALRRAGRAVSGSGP